jgi:hypothetical protein
MIDQTTEQLGLAIQMLEESEARRPTPALRRTAAGKGIICPPLQCGGERAAATYSLIATAKLNAINRGDYLRDVFACIAGHPNNCIIDFAVKLAARRSPSLKLTGG